MDLRQLNLLELQGNIGYKMIFYSDIDSVARYRDAGFKDNQ